MKDRQGKKKWQVTDKEVEKGERGRNGKNERGERENREVEGER